MKKLILLSSAAVASGVLFANIYNSMVNGVATDSDIPNSIIAGKEFFKTVNPGAFFQIFSPASQILTLASIILFWKHSKKTRIYLGIALVCFISADIMAFTYFHPRTDLMFSDNIPDIATLKRLSSEWMTMNWVRSFILGLGLVFSFRTVDHVYTFPDNKLS